MVCGNAQGRPTTPRVLVPGTQFTGSRSNYTCPTPRPTGNSVVPVLSYSFPLPGGHPSSLFQLICEQGTCSCTHPQDLPLLPPPPHRCFFSGKKDFLHVPLLSDHLPTASCLHDPAQLPDGSSRETRCLLRPVAPLLALLLAAY